jgi:regulator of replication initiation timing
MRAPALFCLTSLLALTPFSTRAAEIDVEDFNQLRARVGAQDESIETFRTALQRLREELTRLRSENETLRAQLTATPTFATQDQLTKLVDQVRDVEKNRAKDKDQILEAIEKLKALPPTVVPAEPVKPPVKPTEKEKEKEKEKVPDKPTAKPAETGTKPADKPADTGPELPAEYYEHKVAEGDTVGAIIEAYNKEHGLKVRLNHVLKANPTLKDPRRLRAGQDLRIPAIK